MIAVTASTSKVGDTLTVTVEDADGEDVDLTTGDIQWYAGNEPIVGETDDTLDVTDAMVGLQIFAEFTDAEGKTYESDPTEPVYVYSFEIEEAKASKVNEITVTFANPVEAENVTFTVTKGTAEFSIEDTDWSLTEDEAVLTMSANMTKGTYKVTATDKVTEATDYYEFDVDKQEAAQIIFLNEEALTNETKDEAYAYYDVKDQYGQSIRTSASIQWSGSCDITADKATGRLTLKKHAAGDDWVYNEQIYITGVYIKNGTAESTTLTVGTQQSLDSIEPVGFLKKGTSDIIDPDDKIPADFKTHEYYLLFNALDKNGCPLDADDIDKEDVTFISTDPLVVKELTEFEPHGLTVKGTEYCAVFIEPGINVSKGGEVTIKAIANKTGNQAELNFIVGDDPVPVSFTISAPTVTVADGDQDVVIPFTALDQEENPITNFRALAKQEIFNKLSFTASEGSLTLKETDSGAAELTWSDEAKYVDDTAWALSSSTDDIDRPVSLTVVVVSGESDNEMMYVQDKRRPNSIDSVLDLDAVLVEGAKSTLNLNSFVYKDQYGKIIDADGGDSTGFFAAGAPGAETLKGLEFADYTFGVKVEYAGTGYIEIDNANTDTTYLSKTAGDADGKQAVVSYKTGGVALNNVSYKTTTDIQSAASGEGFKFSIVKFKPIANPANDITNPDDWDAVSPTTYHGITVVDITQVKSFKIGKLNTFYTGKLDITGDKIIAADSLENLKDSDYVTPAKSTAELGQMGIYDAASDYRQSVLVTGDYAGTEVKIPHDYYTIESVKGTLVDANAKIGEDDADAFTVIGNIALTDLYDRTTANGTWKFGTDQVKATIEKVYNGLGWWAYTADDGLHVSTTMEKAVATGTLNDTNRLTEEAKIANGILGGNTVTKDNVANDTTGYEGTVHKTALEGLDPNFTLQQTALSDAQDEVTDTADRLTATEKRAADKLWDADQNKDTPTVSAGSADTAAEALIPADDAATDDIWTTENVAAAKAYMVAKLHLLKAQDDLEEAKADYAKAEKEAKAEKAVKEFKTKFTQAIADNGGDTQVDANGGVYDSTTAPITFSDQAPYAASISGVKESYILNPEKTDTALTGFAAAEDIEVLDQYGVATGDTIIYTVSDARESTEGYAENNFKVTGNGSDTVTISGAERGDTFTLVLSVAGTELKTTTSVAIGADEWAAIVDEVNLYTVNTAEKKGLKAVLEAQRLAGLQ